MESTVALWATTTDSIRRDVGRKLRPTYRPHSWDFHVTGLARRAVDGGEGLILNEAWGFKSRSINGLRYRNDVARRHPGDADRIIYEADDGYRRVDSRK